MWIAVAGMVSATKRVAAICCNKKCCSKLQRSNHLGGFLQQTMCHVRIHRCIFSYS